MSTDTDRLIKALHRIGDGIYELEETMCRIENDMFTMTREAGRVHTIAGLMFNSGHALDRLNEISQALQEIQKHHERD